MVNNVKKGKATAFDGSDESLFTFCSSDSKCSVSCESCLKKVNLLQTFIRREYWSAENTQLHFTSRIVPLNKAHPATLKIDEYRPLIICSPSLSSLKLIYSRTSKNYLSKSLHVRQYGFVPNCSIEHAKTQLLDRLHLARRQQTNLLATFIDMRSAYNRVDLTILYKIIRDKNALSPEKLQLLEFIHSNNATLFGSQLL